MSSNESAHLTLKVCVGLPSKGDWVGMYDDECFMGHTLFDQDQRMRYSGAHLQMATALNGKQGNNLHITKFRLHFAFFLAY